MGLMDSYTARRCNKCHVKERNLKPAENGERLKKCARCGTLYCSRGCQRADWSSHKTQCGKGIDSQQAMAEELDSTLALFSGKVKSPKAPKFIRDATFLSSQSPEQALGYIVDSYRLRIEDEYALNGNPAGLYAQEDPVGDFKEYLDVAEQKGGILPSWWNTEKRADCVRLGEAEGWHCLQYAVQKSDIIEKYGDRLMPMKLRMIAQMVTGVQVGT